MLAIGRLDHDTGLLAQSERPQEASMKRRASILGGLALSAALAAGPVNAAVGPPHLGFYVDGTAYRTVGTPTDLSATGAPASSFDILYAIAGQELAVAAAAPGDQDYNGGRWMRFPVTWNTAPYPLTSEEQVLEAASLGDVTIASEPDMLFVCPVIKA
jgi:hypothetical protein